MSAQTEIVFVFIWIQVFEHRSSCPVLSSQWGRAKCVLHFWYAECLLSFSVVHPLALTVAKQLCKSTVLCIILAHVYHFSQAVWEAWLSYHIAILWLEHMCYITSAFHKQMRCLCTNIYFLVLFAHIRWAFSMHFNTFWSSNKTGPINSKTVHQSAEIS